MTILSAPTTDTDPLIKQHRTAAVGNESPDAESSCRTGITQYMSDLGTAEGDACFFCAMGEAAFHLLEV